MNPAKEQAILPAPDPIESLSVPLPADVRRLISAGCLQEARERIHFYLERLNWADSPLSGEQRQKKSRLTLELARLSQLPFEYP